MIKIALRFCPFSHLPGTKFPIPFSTKGVQIFPSALVLLPENLLIPLAIKGPVSKFTSTLDLERGVIKVFGESEEGYFRYYLFSKKGELCFFQDKGTPIFPKNLMPEEKLRVSPHFERISFGSSKKLDWDLVKRRGDLKEILPVWFQLGQMIPIQDFKGEPSLLERGQLELLFNAGFSGILYPEKEDVTHSGLSLPPLGESENPFVSLTEGYKIIRSKLLIEEENTCYILPSFPYPEGRAIGLKTKFGSVDLEWTKGFLRKMWIHCEHTQMTTFAFPKTHKSCHLDDKKLNLNCVLDLSASNEYFLDHFKE